MYHTSSMSTTSSSINSGLRSRWGWFVILGIALLILGLIAFSNLFVATIASALVIGATMLVGGILHIIEAFPFRSWGSFLYWLLSGIVYAAAGLFALYNPALAATALTLALAFMLLTAGILRIIVGVQSRSEYGWGWLVASGVLTTLTSLVIAIGWPFDTLWVLGLFLAVDLIFQGVSATAFGIGLRSSVLARRPSSTTTAE